MEEARDVGANTIVDKRGIQVENNDKRYHKLLEK